MARTLYCSACFQHQPFDENWRALHIDADGDLILTRPEHEGEEQYERPGTVFACGEGTALVLVERYLHTGSFEHQQQSAATLTDLYSEIPLCPPLT